MYKISVLHAFLYLVLFIAMGMCIGLCIRVCESRADELTEYSRIKIDPLDHDVAVKVHYAE